MGTRANLLAGGGMLYVAATGTALPESDNLDTGIVVPGEDWAPTGFRMGPLDVEYDPKIGEIFVEEHLAAVKAILEAEGAMLSTELAERDQSAMAMAISALTSGMTEAAANQTGKSSWAVGDGSLVELSLLFVGKSPAGFSRVIFVPLAVANAKVKDSYGKKHAGLNTQWMAMADPAQPVGTRLFQVFDITAVPTS